MSIPNTKYTAFLRKWKQEIEILCFVINDRWIHYPGFSAIPAPKILSNNHKYLLDSCCSICNFERQRSLKIGQKWQYIKPSFPRTSAVSSSDWGLVEGWRNWSGFKKSPRRYWASVFGKCPSFTNTKRLWDMKAPTTSLKSSKHNPAIPGK